MSFAEELELVLPQDLPHRDKLIVTAARHLELIAEANEYMNLTRITSEREAAIKHVLDSVLPWCLFEGAGTILDAGSGAGFPGIPMAVVLPESRFILSESIQKKARFLESAVAALGLTNVEVSAQRAEDLLKSRRVDIITARAMAPLNRALGLFAPGLRNGARALLYKGPDVETEIAEAASEGKKRKVIMRVIERYELPDALGTRTIVHLST